MSGTAQKDFSKLSRQVSERQTRTLVELVIDVLAAMEHQDRPVSTNTQDEVVDPVVKDKEHRVMAHALKRLLVLSFALLTLLHGPFASTQSISEQKRAVVFIFGTVHPTNPDGTAITDAKGVQVAVEMPLGTGFFVAYPSQTHDSRYNVSYLVTAKHVLQDADGSFLPNVKIRLNLRIPVGDSQLGFINDIPVTDAQGNLLWLHGENQAEDVAATPLRPDNREFDVAAISTTRFLHGRSLPPALSEGDELYFIGLMNQYYGTKRNYPLVRRGTMALITDENIDTPSGPQRVFIAALESWPGNSGAPVFLLRGLRNDAFGDEENAGFLGIIVASFVNKVSIPLSAEPSGRQLEGGDKANTGMTCIIPASVIAEVLDSFSAQQDRDLRRLNVGEQCSSSSSPSRSTCFRR